MDSGLIAIISLCVFLALWYGGGYLYNRRRGQRLFRWLEAGLDVLGGERAAGWIGSPAAGARINVTHADAPFRRLELTLLLENREIPLLWLWDRLHGKRDWLIIKGTLRSPRKGEIEVFPAGARLGQDLCGEQKQPWTCQESLHGLSIAFQGLGAQRQVAGLKPWLETWGAQLSRLSWRKQDPHIQLQMKVTGLLSTSSARFLADLQTALEKTMRGKAANVREL